MSEIRFEEEQAITRKMRRAQQKKKTTSLGRFLVKLSGGCIKDQRQVNKVLVIIIIILCIYSTYLLTTKVFA